jgi:geranylgeranyl reductase family protein
MPMAEPCDVLVCGAGPSGSTAALELARSGLKTVLCDRQSFPRDKTCAGWLNARAFSRFDFLAGKAEELAERAFSELVFLSPNLGQRISYRAEEPQGYLVSRRRFDHSLVEMAVAAGATLVQGTGLTELWPADDSVLSVLEDGRRYQSRFLVGADGVRSSVGRLSGLNPGFADDQLVVAVEQEFRASEELMEELGGDGGRILVVLAYNYIPGYGWVFPHRETVSVGVGARMSRVSNIGETHRKFVTDLRAGGLLPDDGETREPRSAELPAGAALKLPRLAEGRVLLVGDAGGFVGAASGEGIYPGMRSGQLAAQAIAEGCVHGREAEVAVRYQAAFRRELAKYLEMPAVELSLVMDLLFRDQRVANKLARAFLFGEPL